MENFKNGTLSSPPFPLKQGPDMGKLGDIITAGGSGRNFFDGSYSPYGYYGGYPMGPNTSTVSDIVVGLAVIGAIIFTFYLIFAVVVRLQRGYYFGYRKKRSVGTMGASDLDILLGKESGANTNIESWRNGHPSVMRMMQTGDIAEGADMTTKIVEAIEKKSLDYDSTESP